MKILVSAYACEPNKGSEPGVGWSWVTELSKSHDVWVLTRDNNKDTIDEYLNLHPEYCSDRLHFVYVGLSKKLTFWKKGRRGMRLFYMMWQKKALEAAIILNNDIGFDIVQHVTFVSFTQPTYMYKLGVPLIWGSVSGGENIPSEIKINMTTKEKIVELIRKLSQGLALLTPCIRKTMECSKYILTATEETREKIPKKYQTKTIVVPAIGMEKLMPSYTKTKEDNKIKIVMAGRLIYWKAFDLGIKAVKQILDEMPNLELHILGEGEKKKELMQLAGEYLNRQIFFDEPVVHDNIFEYYAQFDLFLNTTLRDSGCMTMMEAMSVGVPCIAVNTGGPKVLLGTQSFGAVEPNDYGILVDNLSDKIREVLSDNKLRNSIAEKQIERIKTKFLVAEKVKILDKLYRSKE